MAEVTAQNVDLAVNNLRCNDCVVHKKLTVKNLEVESLKFVTVNAQQGDLLTLGENGKIEFSDGASGGGAGALENVEDPLTGDGTIGNPLTLSTAGATENSVLTFNGTAWAIGTQLSQGSVPDLFFNNYNQDNLNTYINYLTQVYSEPNIHVRSFDPGIVVDDAAYEGAVFSPYQNRIYFVPTGQADQLQWHYVDCNTGTFGAYTHGATVVDNAYIGGAYFPVLDRIYFAPFSQSAEANWHYVDCSDGSVVAYARGGTSTIQYSGAVYSPNQQRLYFIPSSIVFSADNLVFIDENGTLQTYSPGFNILTGYLGGAYSPTQDRIYFAPYTLANQTTWHFIDCSTGLIVAYDNNVSAEISNPAYSGAVYSPTQNRIYFGPNAQSTETFWHFIDCDTGNVVSYTNTSSFGIIIEHTPVFSPLTNRIYLLDGTTNSSITFIDCSDGSIVTETNVSPVAFGEAFGGAYSPTENRIYAALGYNIGVENWFYIEELASASVSTSLMGGPLFNKSL